MNVRYVVTHIGREGMRTLAHTAQGRFTYATAGEAQAWIDSAMRNNGPDKLRSVYGMPLEVRPVECWPGHNDPRQCYFD